MSFLVVSHRHDLIPFAYRLKLEGQTTQLVVCNSRFERVWEGKFDQVLAGRNPTRGRPADFEEVVLPALKPALEMAKENHTVVLSDNRKVAGMFAGVRNFYGVTELEETPAPQSPVRLGGWFNGEEFQNPHLLVCDIGVWPGGLGPLDLGGLTLVRLDAEYHGFFNELTSGVKEALVAAGFRGLVQMGLAEAEPGGALGILGVTAGWPFLQTHAFVSELDSLATLLQSPPATRGGQALLSKKVVTVVPVSLPPWPRQAQGGVPAGLEIGGLTPQQAGRVFWHDVSLDAEKHSVSTGGLDGLLGVPRGAADTPELARQKVLAVALAMEFPEKQFRIDAGAQVPRVLAELEARYGIVL